MGTALALLLAFVAYSFVGTFVLAVFVYYGTRPFYHFADLVLPELVAGIQVQPSAVDPGASTDGLGDPATASGPTVDAATDIDGGTPAGGDTGDASERDGLDDGAPATDESDDT